MTFQIYYHNDFDGIASAGIFSHFLHHAASLEKSVDYIAIDYNELDRYLNKDFGGDHAVVDFPFNQTVKWWFDHHETSFKTESLRERYIPSGFQYWDPNAKSCPSLLFDFFKKNYPDYYSKWYNRFHNLIIHSDLIDSALYKSPAEVYDFNNPYIVFNHILNNMYSEVFNLRFIGLIAEGQYEDFFSSHQFKRKEKEIIEIHKEFSLNYEDIVQVRQNIIELNFLKANLKGQRYFGYLYNPDADFTITIDKRGKDRYISVGYNPWKNDNSLNIGALLKRYGGGGRKNVGAVLIRDKIKFEKVLNEIRRKLLRPASSPIRKVKKNQVRKFAHP
ncbi:MAG: hypothetical protein GY940_26225 [bacterium]|nr:hypothetical protein [bacterium]